MPSRLRFVKTSSDPNSLIIPSFSGSFNPLSAGYPVFSNAGSSWTQARTSGGLVYGTEVSPPNTYDDSHAYVSSLFGADFDLSATIFKGSTSTPQEVELLARWNTNGTNNTTGYEAFYAHDGAYVSLARWNGALGDYTYIGQEILSLPVPVTGSVLRFKLQGFIAQIFLDAELVLQEDIRFDALGQPSTPFVSGYPGMGFYRENVSGAADQYGFTSFSATRLG